MSQSVKTICVSQPVDDAPMELPEDIVSYCARVSNPDNQDNFESSTGLLKYLIKHSHWSPFEMVNITMEIKTTRDIARQILRHRSFAFQKFSQRYADPTDMKFSLREARLQDEDNRQNSVECEDTDVSGKFVDHQLYHISESIARYKAALDDGIAKEQARCFLPEGNTPSVMYMQGSLRSWIHYIQLRSGNGTQKEHTEIAKMCGDELVKYFPSIVGIVSEE